MKVVLIKDVNKIGKTGDTLDVADGYARNFLIARGLAHEATSGLLAEVEGRKASERAKETKLKKEAEELKERIQGKTVKVLVNAGENGKLFGSVTSAQISEALKKEFEIEVEKRGIKLSDAVKQAGNFPFSIHLFKGVEANMTLSVEVTSERI